VQACKSPGLQTLSFGHKSQIIGAKEQGQKRACDCARAYMMLASPSSHSQNNCKTMSEKFGARYALETAKHRARDFGARA
jgi:hypothetical protein